jgi:adenylate cyclase
MEYAVIGDAVNVASRIEHLTREMDTDLVVSDYLMTHVTDQSLRDSLELTGEKTVRGRDGALTLWWLIRLFV